MAKKEISRWELEKVILEVINLYLIAEWRGISVSINKHGHLIVEMDIDFITNMLNHYYEIEASEAEILSILEDIQMAIRKNNKKQVSKK